MISHFDLAVEARGHVISGDLRAFREAVTALSDLEPADDLDAGILLQLGPMRWEARQAATARTVEAAASGAAKIAATCGDCHLANGDPLADRFTIGGPPPPGTAARHMAGLAWASRLLWDGVIGPSDRTWLAGAEGLVELGALPEGLPADLPPGDVRIAGMRLQQLGGRAALLGETQDRVEMLGEIWTVCASCHAGG
jgi:cytochrome c553